MSMNDVVEVRLTRAEAIALIGITNHTLMDGEVGLEIERLGAETALKRVVTALGHVPETEAGMVKIGRKLPK